MSESPKKYEHKMKILYQSLDATNRWILKIPQDLYKSQTLSSANQKNPSYHTEVNDAIGNLLFNFPCVPDVIVLGEYHPGQNIPLQIRVESNTYHYALKGGFEKGKSVRRMSCYFRQNSASSSVSCPVLPHRITCYDANLQNPYPEVIWENGAGFTEEDYLKKLFVDFYLRKKTPKEKQEAMNQINQSKLKYYYNLCKAKMQEGQINRLKKMRPKITGDFGSCIEIMFKNRYMTAAHIPNEGPNRLHPKKVLDSGALMYPHLFIFGDLNYGAKKSTVSQQNSTFEATPQLPLSSDTPSAPVNGPNKRALELNESYPNTTTGGPCIHDGVNKPNGLEEKASCKVNIVGSGFPIAEGKENVEVIMSDHKGFIMEMTTTSYSKRPEEPSAVQPSDTSQDSVFAKALNDALEGMTPISLE